MALTQPSPFGVSRWDELEVLRFCQADVPIAVHLSVRLHEPKLKFIDFLLHMHLHDLDPYTRHLQTR